MKKLRIALCAVLLLSIGINFIDTDMHAATRGAERYFYKELTEEQKHIYDTIVASAEVDGGLMSGNAKVPIDMTGSFANASATEDEIIEYIRTLQLDKVTYAITRDHPELFWIYFQNVGFSRTYEDGRLILTLDPVDDYYWDGITSEDQVKRMKSDLDAQVNEIISVCKTNDDFQTLSCVNKWLIENNKYNHSAANNTISYELSWSAISGLLSNNDESKGPVCYGYAMAFKLLCDRLGIPCIEVEGRGRTSESADEGHAWNYVQMQDGNWYAVDTTWNDVSELAGQSRYFLVGSDTITMSGTIDKFSLNHVAAPNRNYPALSTNAYNGFKGVADVNGTVYATLQEAIDNANGKPIDLLAEVDITSTLNIPSNIVIDMNGNSIVNRSDPTITPLIRVADTGTLTLYEDSSRTADPKYEGDVVQKNQNGTLIENNGKLVLRSVQLESPMTLVSGNAYELGSHSVSIASGKKFLNIGEVVQPTLSVTEVSVASDELEDKTTAALLTYLNDKLPTLTYAYAKGGTPLHPVTAVWTFKETGNVVDGETYTLTTNVYGYDIEVPVKYGTVKTPLTGSIKLSGKAEINSILTVDITDIKQPNLGELTYEWRVDGNTIAQETTNTYKIKDTDEGKSITAKVTSQNYSGYLFSSPIEIKKPSTPVDPDSTPDPGEEDNKDIVIRNETGNITVQGKVPSDSKVVTKEVIGNVLDEKIAKITTVNILEKYIFERVFDITLMRGNDTYNLDEEVIVTIRLSDDLLDKELGILYLTDDGEIEEIPSWIKDKNISFETTHFSTYAIVSKNPTREEEKDTIEVDENTGVRTGDVTTWNIFMCLLLSSAGTIFLLNKLK